MSFASLVFANARCSSSVAMAVIIPPPALMKLSGNLSANWEIFQAEYEDYTLATGLGDKPKLVQAATLRSVITQLESDQRGASGHYRHTEHIGTVF